MHRFLIIIILIGSFINAQTYLDSTAAIDDRVDDLLSRMTLAEKIGQMTQAERTAFDSEQDITTASIQINDNPLDNISFPVTGGWQDWTTVAQQIVLEAGESTLKIVCNVGGFNINWIEFETVTSLINSGEHIPAQTGLFQNYPNPFNPETQIHFELEKPSHVNITIFDLQGRALKTITDGYYQAGQYSVKVNISDFPSGTYIYKMTTGTYSEMKKMLLLK